MPDFITASDLVDAGREVLRTELDPDGKGTVDLYPGSDLNTLLSVAAGMLTPLLAHHADRVAARTVEGASGYDLRVKALDDYQITASDGYAARTTIYLTRPTTDATSIPKGSRFAVKATATQPAVMFGADADVAVAQGTTKIAVPVTCLVAGTTGNVTRDVLTQIVDSLPDPKWAIYTPTIGDPFYPPDSIGGGMDAQTDAELQAEIGNLPRDASRKFGLLPGMRYAALQVPGVVHVVVVEPLDGTVLLFVGDAGYNLPNALREAVLLAMESYRGLGVPARVRGFTVGKVNVRATVYLQRGISNFDTAALSAKAVQAVADYFALNRSQPDEYFRDAIEAAIVRAVGASNVQTIDLQAPVADVKRLAITAYPALSSLPRYTADRTTIAITFTGPLTQ